MCMKGVELKWLHLETAHMGATGVEFAWIWEEDWNSLHTGYEGARRYINVFVTS